MTSSPPPRLVSLDAYRGFIMVAMASAGLAVAAVHRKLDLDSPLWNFLAFQLEHVDWVGCSFWDLIQPSFLFMVGVALPFSFAGRAARGGSYGRALSHAVWRALILVLLGVFLNTPGPLKPYPTTIWEFPNVLCQIGLGYVFVFLLAGRGLAAQLAAVGVLLVGYSLYFGLYPVPHAEGWLAHWDKNSNAAHFFDVWFLNLLPRSTPFELNKGGYQTLNFVPSMATMILGLIAGERLLGAGTPARKFAWLAGAAVACLGLGLAMGEAVPIVKRIWTPSWAVYSAGWTFAMLAAFYVVIDVLGWKAWSLPLVVVGMNSIAMYLMSQLIRPWVRLSLKVHLGSRWFDGDYGPIVEAAAILGVLWLICAWLYRQRIFLRI